MITQKNFNSDPSKTPFRPCRSLTVQFNTHYNCVSMLTQPQLHHKGAFRNVKVLYSFTQNTLWNQTETSQNGAKKRGNLSFTTHNAQPQRLQQSCYCFWVLGTEFYHSELEFFNENEKICSFSRIPLSMITQKIFNSDPSNTPFRPCRSLTVQFNTHYNCISMLTQPQLDHNAAFGNVKVLHGFI